MLYHINSTAKEVTTMKEFWSSLSEAIAWVLATLIFGAAIFIPVTVVAWCIQFWINLLG